MVEYTREHCKIMQGQSNCSSTPQWIGLWVLSSREGLDKVGNSPDTPLAHVEDEDVDEDDGVCLTKSIGHLYTGATEDEEVPQRRRRGGRG